MYIENASTTLIEVSCLCFRVMDERDGRDRDGRDGRDRDGRDGRSSFGGPPRRFGEGRREGGREGSPPPEGRVRPKLILKPRSLPVEDLAIRDPGTFFFLEVLITGCFYSPRGRTKSENQKKKLRLDFDKKKE